MEYLPETEAEFIDRVFRDMKGRRHDKGMTQYALADRIGKTQNYVSVRERGAHPMSLSDALLIAAALDMPQMGKQMKPPSRVSPSASQAAKDRKTAPAATTTGGTRIPPFAPHPPKPTPKQMPPKGAPAPVKVAGVAKVPQMVAPKDEGPKTFLWTDEVTVNRDGTEAKLGLLALEGEAEAVVDLPMADARRLKEMLSLKLPHQDTEASSYVTTMLDRVNRAMAQGIAQNRRTKVMRMIQPEVMAVMTDVWAEMRDVKAGATKLEADLVREMNRLEQRIAELQGKPRPTRPVDAEEVKVGQYKTNSELAEKVSRQQRELDDLKSQRATLESKLERLRKEMEAQDGVVERLRKELAEQKSTPSGAAEELKKALGEADQALTILDELWDLATELRESGNADNKMTGMAIQIKMKEMGYVND